MEDNEGRSASGGGGVAEMNSRPAYEMPSVMSWMAYVAANPYAATSTPPSAGPASAETSEPMPRKAAAAVISSIGTKRCIRPSTAGRCMPSKPELTAAMT